MFPSPQHREVPIPTLHCACPVLPMMRWEAVKAKAGRNSGRNKVFADGQEGMPSPCTALGFWDTGLNAMLSRRRPEVASAGGVRRHELMAFDQSGGIVAIAERSPCACR